MIVYKKSWQLVVCSSLLLACTTLCLQADEIAWQSDFNRARQTAHQQGKPLLVHFWSESCGPCKNLERYVFPHPDVARVVNGVVPVKINTRQQPKVAQQFGIQRIPTDILIAPDGRELWRGISPSTVNAYIAMVTQAVDLQKTHAAKTGLSELAAAARRRNRQFAGQTDIVDQTEIVEQTGIVGQTGYAARPRRENSTGPNSVRQQPAPTNPYSRTLQGQSHGQYGTGDRPAGGEAFQVGGGSFQPSGSGFQASPVSSQPNRRSASPRADSQSSSPPTNQRAERKQPITNPHFDGTQRRPPARPQTPPANPMRPNTPQRTSKPKFALDGYCPVSLLEERRWVKGDPRWGVVHRGQTYVFASEAKAKKFWSAPDAYSPLLSGYDPVKFAENQTWAEGKRQFGVFYKDQRTGKTAIVLFADEAALQRFWKAPEAYSGRVQQAMQYNGPVRRR